MITETNRTKPPKDSYLTAWPTPDGETLVGAKRKEPRVTTATAIEQLVATAIDEATKELKSGQDTLMVAANYWADKYIVSEAENQKLRERVAAAGGKNNKADHAYSYAVAENSDLRAKVYSLEQAQRATLARAISAETANKDVSGVIADLHAKLKLTREHADKCVRALANQEAAQVMQFDTRVISAVGGAISGDSWAALCVEQAPDIYVNVVGNINIKLYESDALVQKLVGGRTYTVTISEKGA